MCGDADKRINVEVAMCKKGVGWVLCELTGGKEAKTESNTMDIDNTAKIEVLQDRNTSSWLDCPSILSQTSFGHISTNSSMIPTVLGPA